MFDFFNKSKLLFAFLAILFIGNVWTKSKRTRRRLHDEKKVETLQKVEHNFKYAIFDVSGTLWKKRTYDILYAYQKKKGVSLGYYWKLLNFGTSYLFGNFDPKKAFESFLDCCKNSSVQELKKGCSEIWQSECKACLYREPKDIFDKLKNNGAKMILVEVGMQELYADLLDIYKFDYMFFSELEIKDNKVSGKLVGEPCIGTVKYDKVKNLVENELKGYLKDAVFYASSHLDIPLLEVVGKAVAVNPTSQLESHAKKKGWEILKFKDKDFLKLAEPKALLASK